MKEKKTVKNVSERRTSVGMESYLINLSMRRAAEMLENGNAPAQIISHFLKLGSEKAKYEREKLKAETQLAISKARSVEAQTKYEEIAAEALAAFKRYYGAEDEEEFDEDDEYI